MKECELKFAIVTRQRSLETDMDEIASLDHGHAGMAAIRVTVIHPEKRHPLNVAPGAAVREGGMVSPPPLLSSPGPLSKTRGFAERPPPRHIVRLTALAGRLRQKSTRMR
jgi:hypothetical protein